MAKYQVAIYSWEKSRENWVFVFDAWIDPREITDIDWYVGKSDIIGDLSAVTVFKARENTYVTLAMSRKDANYLNEKR